MDIRGFQVWLSAARGLTRAQRREALVLSGRSEQASKAAIELGVGEARRCPHCASGGRFRAVRGVCTSAGCAQDLQRARRQPGLHHKRLSFEGGDGEGLGGALRRR